MVSTVMKAHKKWKMNSHFKFLTLLFVVIKFNFIDFLTTLKSDVIKMKLSKIDKVGR